MDTKQDVELMQRFGVMRPWRGFAFETGKLIAWIDTTADGEIVAAFVSEAMRDKRLPARKVCGSVEQAYAWVEREAAYVDLAVEWMDPPDPSR